MARIRTIKPDFFQSEDVASLTYRARLTWIGLWTYVDDAGRCKDNIRLIKGHVWPLEDDVTASAVELDLDQLASSGRIVRYEADGERFIQVHKWADHQRISRPTPSKIPEPSRPPASSGNEPSKPIQEPLTEDSVSPPGGLTTGKEGKGKEVEGKGTPHTLPSDFSVSEDMRTWATRVTPAVDIDRQTFDFIHYWAKGGGTGKKKSDWTRTWQNNMKQKQEWAERDGWKPPPAPGKDLNDPKNW